MNYRERDKYKGQASENRLKLEVKRLNFYQTTKMISLEKEKESLKSQLRMIQNTSGKLDQRHRVQTAGFSPLREGRMTSRMRHLSEKQGHSISDVSFHPQAPDFNNNTESTGPATYESRDTNLRARTRQNGMRKYAKNTKSNSLPTLSVSEASKQERLPLIFTTATGFIGNNATEPACQADSVVHSANTEDSTDVDRQNEAVFGSSDYKVGVNKTVDDIGNRNRSNSLENKNDHLRPGSRNLSKSEQSLPTAWYTNIDQARVNITKRLSNSMVSLETSVSAEEKDGKNISTLDAMTHLYAAPDGLPRTKYLMPDSDERFSEARRARYIRKPGTKLNPVEKELNVEEIFRDLNDEKEKEDERTFDT